VSPESPRERCELLVHSRDVKPLRVEPATDPLLHRGVLVVALVRKHLEKLRVATRPAAVFGRASSRAAGADERLVALIRQAEDLDVVLPLVAVVIAVDEPRSYLRDGAERRGVLVDQEIFFFVIDDTEADLTDIKVVKMGVRPPERDLKNIVQDAERRSGGHANAAPDDWLDVAQRDAELEGVTERGRSEVHGRHDTKDA